MKRPWALFAVSFLFTCLSPWSADAQALKSGIFYPGWVQLSLAPEKVDTSAFTHVFHFSMFPTSSGEVLIGDIQSPELARRAVAVAHARGLKIILSIGGEGLGRPFIDSTRDARHRLRLVSNIVKQMTRFGYDGVDIDWEEGVGPGPFVALIRELRAALPAGKILTVDVTSGLVTPATVARVIEEIDLVNVMSYVEQTPLADEYEKYVRAGIPAAKLAAGLGLAKAYADSPREIDEKIRFARTRNMGGVVSWSLEEGLRFNDRRLSSIRDYRNESER